MDVLKIFIDRLKSEETEHIQQEVLPDFIDVHEADCDFSSPVQIQGEAYLANDHLVIHLKASTAASIPCRTCNGPLKTPVSVDFTHTVDLTTLTNPVFDYSVDLREALLLQTPQFVECASCPERDTVNKYLKQPHSSQFPFSNL